MSNLVFNARFTPKTCTALSADTFQVTADIFDGAGYLGGDSIDVGQAVFLDTTSSGTSPGSISKYVITGVLSKSYGFADVTIQYIDTGVVVDPSEILDYAGFVCAQDSMTELSYHAAATKHVIPPYVVEYARSYDNYIKLPTLLTNTASSSALKARFINATGGVLSALSFVCQTPDGSVKIPSVSNSTECLNIIGVLPSPIANMAFGDVVVHGIITNIGTSFLLNDIIYLKKDGTWTHTPPEIGSEGFVEGDFVVRIGKITRNKDNAAHKDLFVEPVLIGQL